MQHVLQENVGKTCKNTDKKKKNMRAIFQHFQQRMKTKKKHKSVLLVQKYSVIAKT